MTEEYQKLLDKEDKDRIMAMNPRDMKLPEFMVYKGIVNVTDFDRRWNLNITRDCYIGAVKKIETAMTEWAEIKAKEEVFYYIAQQQ